MIKPDFAPIPNIKVMINVGALMDIPTGTYIIGRHGESILNGGLAFMTGVVGIGNNFKSTVMHYMFLTAMARMCSHIGNTYDTEINIHEWHLKTFAARIPEFKLEDVIDSGRWVITDKSVAYADAWFEKLKDFIRLKRGKESHHFKVKTPFWNRDRSGNLEILRPSFSEVDSLSEFESENVAEVSDKNDLGDSSRQTVFMKQGLVKSQFLMEIPALSAGGYNYILISAHIGKGINMDPKAPPEKQLQYLKNGDKIKNATGKFMFLMNNCYHCYNASPEVTKDKTPEYPRYPDDNLEGDTDLNSVWVRNLRSKSGASGMSVQLIVSQSEGVLPSLTEFHYIKSNDRYGISGTQQHYALDLYPEVKIQRTTVRNKIDTDPKLCRALNITAEMCQMDNLWHTLEEGLLCTPKELYDDLVAKGYDWNILLNTRGWWALEGDHTDVPFLSTMDLLRMRKGLYHPWWLAEDKKTIIEVK